ncbi:hypothetical protein ACFL59_02530 [Planctomycetota bacterium]
MPAFGPVVEGLKVGETVRLVVPQKLPLGGKVKGKKQPGLFRVYFPSRDGGRLELETTAGTIEVRDPNGQPAKDTSGQAVAKGKKVAFEVPLGAFGWYGIVVTGAASYEISSKMVVEGNAKDRDGSMLVPWHFYYFPFTKVNEEGHPSKNWDKKFKAGAFDFESKSYWRSEIDSRGAMRSGLKGHCISKEFVEEYNKHLGREVVKYDDCWWWGHCDAASVASAIFTQPKATGGLKEADLEWAATEIAMCGYALEIRFFLGGLSNNSRSHPSHTEIPKPDPGQSVDKDIGPFHEALIKLLKQEGGVALMDLRAEHEDGKDKSPDVWNQSVYRFRMEIEQSGTDGPGKDEEGLARVVNVKTVIHANADNHDSAGNPEDPKGSGWNRELEYLLNYDPKGKVDANNAANNVKKCSWSKTGKQYYLPRYIFRIKGLGGSGGPGNPKVKLAQLESLGVKRRPVFGG